MHVKTDRFKSHVEMLNLNNIRSGSDTVLIQDHATQILRIISFFNTFSVILSSPVFRIWHDPAPTRLCLLILQIHKSEQPACQPMLVCFEKTTFPPNNNDPFKRKLSSRGHSAGNNPPDMVAKSYQHLLLLQMLYPASHLIHAYINIMYI